MKTTYKVRNDRCMHLAAVRVHDELESWTRHTDFVTRWSALLFCGLVIAGFAIAMLMGLHR